MGLLDDLFEIKQAGANTQFEEMTQAFDDSLGTMLKHKLDSQMLEFQISQTQRQNDRLDKNDDYDSYWNTFKAFTTPVEKFKWMSTPHASELAKSGGIYQDPATWAEMLGDVEDKAIQYTGIKDYGDEFFKATFDQRSNPDMYSMTDIAKVQADADLLGDPNMINHMNRVDAAYKLDLSKSYGMKSANLMRSWLHNPDEGRTYLTADEDKNFGEQIDKGNYVQPLKHMMDIASMKLKEDNDIMQLYSIRYGVLEDMEGLGALTVNEFNDAVGKLDTQFESRWRGITSRGEPKVTGQATPVTRFGLPQYEQITEEDKISLLTSTGKHYSVSDGAVLALPDNAVTYASIGGGPAKMMTGENLRRTASAQPGAVRLSGDAEHQKLSHMPIEILNKVTRGDFGEVSTPLLRAPAAWGKDAVVSQDYSPSNKRYTNISQNQVIMKKDTGVRWRVANISQGEPTSGKYEKYLPAPGPGYSLPVKKIRTTYSSAKAKITLIRDYKDENGQWQQDTEKPMSFDEFIKKYTFPMYQLEMIGGPVNPYNPAGLDPRLLFPQGVK